MGPIFANSREHTRARHRLDLRSNQRHPSTVSPEVRTEVFQKKTATCRPGKSRVRCIREPSVMNAQRTDMRQLVFTTFLGRVWLWHKKGNSAPRHMKATYCQSMPDSLVGLE